MKLSADEIISIAQICFVIVLCILVLFLGRKGYVAISDSLEESQKHKIEMTEAKSVTKYAHSFKFDVGDLVKSNVSDEKGQVIERELKFNGDSPDNITIEKEVYTVRFFNKDHSPSNDKKENLNRFFTQELNEFEMTRSH